MGRKNKRKRSEYRERLGFNPWKYEDPQAGPAPYRNAGNAVSSAPPASVASQNSLCHPRRGDIWFAELGSHPGTNVQDGCRPVFIVSNDIGNRYADTINVLPMTRHLKRKELPCHARVDPEKLTDIRQPLDQSMVLAEQITTISKSALRHFAGHVADDVLIERIDKAVGLQLGLVPDTNTDSTREEKGARV